MWPDQPREQKNSLCLYDRRYFENGRAATKNPLPEGRGNGYLSGGRLLEDTNDFTKINRGRKNVDDFLNFGIAFLYVFLDILAVIL